MFFQSGDSLHAGKAILGSAHPLMPIPFDFLTAGQEELKVSHHAGDATVGSAHPLMPIPDDSSCPSQSTFLLLAKKS